MADDIVLKIAVEGESEAADALEKVGDAASTSFDQTAKAAETAGVSIEDFGKLSEKTQQAYVDLAKRIEESSQGIVASTKEVQQSAEATASGAKDVGGGLENMSEKSGLSSKEMRSLGKIMRELGLGEAAGLALSFQKVGSSFGVLGVAALGFAAVGGGVVKFVKDVKEANKTLEDLSATTGASVESLRALGQAFEFAGVGAKQFKELTTGLVTNIADIGPRIDGLIAETAEKVTRAQATLNKARAEQEIQPQILALQSQQLVFQTAQLRLQGQQLAQNLSTIQQQLSVIGQVQAMETRRAGLAVADAAANLRMLELKRMLMRGQISQEEFDQASAQEEAKALDRAIAKAKIDLENAKLERDALDEKQAAQRSSLELQEQQIQLQQKQLPMQEEQLRLQAEQNALARQQFEQLRGLDVAAAGRKLAQAQADNLGPLIEQVKRLMQGSRELINPLTSVESLMTAIKAAAGQAATASGELGKGFNAAAIDVDRAERALRALFDTQKGLQGARIQEALAGFKLPEEVITSLSKGTAEFEKLRAKSEQISDAMKKLAVGADVEIFVQKFVTKPDGAWQWIGDTFKSAWDNIASLGNTGKQFITDLVTTSVPNAWEWMLTSFESVLQQIKEKWDAFKNSFSTPTPGGGGGGGGASPGGESISPTGVGAPAGASALAMPSSGSGSSGSSGGFGFGGVSIGNNVRAMLDSMANVARGGLTLPSLSAVAGGGGMAPRNLGTLTLALPGGEMVTGLVDEKVADALRRTATMGQIRSGGRKPSRYT